jgi:hypothetical protein
LEPGRAVLLFDCCEAERVRPVGLCIFLSFDYVFFTLLKKITESFKLKN